jgi:hypothetical protein
VSSKTFAYDVAGDVVSIAFELTWLRSDTRQGP